MIYVYGGIYISSAKTSNKIATIMVFYMVANKTLWKTWEPPDRKNAEPRLR